MDRGWSRTMGRLAACAAAMMGCGGCAGCGGEEEAPACSNGLVCEVCPGVPAGDCGGDCGSGLGCIDVNDAIELSTALAGAMPGTCIRLHQGMYDDVYLPGGVTLIGDSPWSTTLSKLTFGAGDQSIVRSLAVTDGGIKIDGATNAHIESVRVLSSTDSAIHVGAGSSVTISTSNIVDSGRYGVYIEELANVTIDQTVISGSQGPGIWAQAACDDMCVCAEPPTLTIKNSLVKDNRITGISLVGAEATLTCVDVIDTMAGDAFFSGHYGGGMSVTCGSQVAAKRVHVSGSADWGILVDGSRAELGGDSDEEGIEVSGSKEMGLWIQNVACPDDQWPCVTLHHGKLSGNGGVGLGITGGSRGIIICKSAISGTKNRILPVFKDGNVGGSEQVGDGLNWLDASQVTIEQLSLSGNERRSVLIDGPVAASSFILSVTQTGGDEMSGVLQQNIASGQQQPQTGGGVSLVVAQERQFAIPNKNLTLPAP